MPDAVELVEKALDRLAKRTGFAKRDSQRQLALTLCDLIEGGHHGMIEAPTGLGKSLAALIPAIAQALANGKRTAIATYTNVLAEQYWYKDLPLALDLFDGSADLKVQFLIGKQRYVCLAEMDDRLPDKVDQVRLGAELGIENEVARLVDIPRSKFRDFWRDIAAPSVCPARACPIYDHCFYYAARRKAEAAHLVLTNHSVVVQSAISAAHSADGKGMLGVLDYLVLDEAHDFFGSALGGLEFEISPIRINAVLGVAGRLEREILLRVAGGFQEALVRDLFQRFRNEMETVQRFLAALPLEVPEPGILATSPLEIEQHEAVKKRLAPTAVPLGEAVCNQVQKACRDLISAIDQWREAEEGLPWTFQEAYRNYSMTIREFGHQASLLMLPAGVSVSYSSYSPKETKLRMDPVDVQEPLKELIWSKTPTALLSATMTIDQQFEFVQNLLGFPESYQETLPSPFDFANHAALYLPPDGAIPDPTLARRQGNEEEYFAAIAREVSQIINILSGRTLVLFHSRRELEEVRMRLRIPEDLPILVQPRSGAAHVGHQFKRNPHASLLALRSFWTGFDAPGETCSCVVLVRVPFEVPTEPTALTRLAYLQQQGRDPFSEHTLAMAKLLIRQGSGRLLRTTEDKGVIALLDPRLTTKRYGQSLLDNLPPEMRQFRDFADAAGWIQIG